MTTHPVRRFRNLTLMFGKASVKRAQIILANGKFWSGVLAAASLSRGTAFIERPPAGGNVTVATGAIEAFIRYPAWGVILLVTAIGIIVGQMHRQLHPIGIVSHCVSIFAYGTFTFSLAIASIWYGSSWSNLGLFMTQTILHFACAIYLGNEIARFRREVSVE